MAEEWLYSSHAWGCADMRAGVALKKSDAIDALIDAGGVYTVAAKTLNCHPYTLKKMIDKDKDLTEILELSMQDLVERGKNVLKMGIDEVHIDKKHALECTRTMLRHVSKVVLKKSHMGDAEDDKQIDTQIIIKRSVAASDAKPG